MMQQSVNLVRLASPLARVTSVVAIGLCAALLGCSDDSINMGEGIPVVEEPGRPSSSGCVDSPVLEGEIIVRNQEELNALEGCEVIDGDLYVLPFEGAHLRTLHALTEVTGVLGIGDMSNAIPSPESLEQFVEFASQQELNEAWLSSLEGLEALESAGRLTLNGLTSEDVRPLLNLRTLTDGSISIWSARNLKSFDGLQNLVGVESLEVSGVFALESFDGLTLPEYMLSLRIENADLRHLKPLGVKGVQSLHLFSNQLQHLDAFASLTLADNISLISNRKLESLMGLRNVEQMSSLVVEYNIAITEVPNFEKVTWVQTVRFVVSPLLAKLPTFSGLVHSRLQGEGSQAMENSLLTRPDVIQVYGMDALTSFTMPAGWTSASLVRIDLNSNLRQIEFTGQNYIEYLSISSNPLLENVSTGALDKVNVLNLAANPLLPATSFDAVRRLDTTSDAGGPP